MRNHRFEHSFFSENRRVFQDGNTGNNQTEYIFSPGTEPAMPGFSEAVGNLSQTIDEQQNAGDLFALQRSVIAQQIPQQQQGGPTINDGARSKFPETSISAREGQHGIFFEKEFAKILTAQIDNEALEKEQQKAMYAWVARVCEAGSSKANNNETPYKTLYTKENFIKGFESTYKGKVGKLLLHSGLSELYSADRKTKKQVQEDFGREILTLENKAETGEKYRQKNIAQAREIYKNGEKKLITWWGDGQWKADDSAPSSNPYKEKSRKGFLVLEEKLKIFESGKLIPLEEVENTIALISTMRLDNKKEKKPLHQFSSSAHSFLEYMEEILVSIPDNSHITEKISFLHKLKNNDSASTNSSLNEGLKAENIQKAKSLAAALQAKPGVNVEDMPAFTTAFTELSDREKIDNIGEVIDYFSLSVKQDIYGLPALFNDAEYTGKNLSIKELEAKINGIQNWIEKTNAGLSLPNSVKGQIEGLEVMLNFYEEKIVSLKGFHKEQGRLTSGNQAYDILYNSDGNLNVDKVLDHAADAYKTIESSLFGNGIPVPPDTDVARFLTELSFEHGISSGMVRGILEGINIENVRGPQNVDGMEIGKFYSEIAVILDTQNPQEKSAAIQNFRNQHGGFITRLLSSQNGVFWNALHVSRTEEQDLVPKTPEQKISQESRTLFEKNYGFNPNAAYLKYTNYYAQAQPSDRQFLELGKWVGNNGEVSPAALKMIEQITAGAQTTDAVKQTQMIKDLQSHFEKRKESIPQSAHTAEKFIKSLEGGDVTNAVENLVDYATNGEMNGTGTALLIGGLILFTKRGRKWLGTPLAFAATAYAANDLTEGALGVDLISEGIRFALGSDAANKNAASGYLDSESSKIFADHEIASRHAEIAGTALGKIPPQAAIEWFDSVNDMPASARTYNGKKSIACATGDPSVTMAYENMKKCCKTPIDKILSTITVGNGEVRDTEQYRAQAMYAYLENFFLKVGNNHKENPEDVASVEDGKNYIAREYVVGNMGVPEKISQQSFHYLNSRNGGNGIILQDVYLAEMSTEMMKDRLDGTSELYETLASTYDVSTELISEKMREWEIDPLKEGKEFWSWIDKTGYKVWKSAENELMFGEQTKKGFTIVKNAVSGAWEVIEDNGGKQVVKFTGDSFTTALDFVKKIPDALKNSVAYVNHFLAGANMEERGKPALAPGGKVNLLLSVQKLGIEDAVMKTYGITQQETLIEFLSKASADKGMQEELQKIATDGRNATTVNNGDVMIFLLGWGGYAPAVAVQGSIDIVETISSIVNQGAQGVVGVVSDDAKAFLMEYEPTKLARIFPRDDIAGQTKFRDFIKTESRESLKSRSAEVFATQGEMQAYVNKKLEAVISKDVIEQDTPFYDLLNTLWNRTAVEGSNWAIDAMNNTTYSGVLKTKISNVNEWKSKVSPNKENAIKMASNQIKRDFADGTFSFQFFTGLGKNKSAADLDKAIVSLFNEKLKEMDWEIK